MAAFKRKTTGKRRTTGESGEWFYCLRHRTVEEGLQCPAKDRLGPYQARSEAERAMEIARERNEEWRNDPRWRDDDDREPEPEDRG